MSKEIILAKGRVAGINNNYFYDIQIDGKSILNIFPRELENKIIVLKAVIEDE